MATTISRGITQTIIRDFTRRHVIVNQIDEIWSADLVDMQNFSKWNKGYKYLLMVIDVVSKYGRIKPLKDKKGETVTKALKTIFKEGRQPLYVGVDRGKEIYNKHLKELLGKHGITIYSTENKEKSSVVEKMEQNNKTESVEIVHSSRQHTIRRTKAKYMSKKEWYCDICDYNHTTELKRRTTSSLYCL